MTAPQRSDSTSLQALCDQALALHQAGRLDQATPLYRQVLAADPYHVDALHFLGVLCLQTGQTEFGVQFIEQALDVRPGDAVAHANLGNGLNMLGRHAEAIAACDRAIALDPLHAEAHGNRALALHRIEGAAAALPSYAQVVALKPSAKAHCNHGVMLHELGRLQEALASFGEAITLDPLHAEAHYNQVVVALALGSAHQPPLMSPPLASKARRWKALSARSRSAGRSSCWTASRPRLVRCSP